MGVDVRREAASPYGEWAGAIDELMSYRYLASRPRALDRDHAEGFMRLRRDLRTPGGMLAAPLCIAMLDVAGINVDAVNILALTQVNMTIADPGPDVREVYLRGRVEREARSQVFTSASVLDADDRSRVLASGSANWSVIVPTPEGFSYPEPGEGVPDDGTAPPLWQAYGAQRRADGSLAVSALSPKIGTDRLHHGPMLVCTEWAALHAAAEALGTDALRVDTVSLTIMQPGRVGPFVTRVADAAITADTAVFRVELVDEGRDARVVAANVVRIGRA